MVLYLVWIVILTAPLIALTLTAGSASLIQDGLRYELRDDRERCGGRCGVRTLIAILRKDFSCPLRNLAID